MTEERAHRRDSPRANFSKLYTATRAGMRVTMLWFTRPTHLSRAPLRDLTRPGLVLTLSAILPEDVRAAIAPFRGVGGLEVMPCLPNGYTPSGTLVLREPTPMRTVQVVPRHLDRLA